MQDCLPEETLRALLAPDTAAAVRAEAEDHLAACPKCRARLARLFDAENERVLAGDPERREAPPAALLEQARDMVPARSSRPRAWLPLAAAVLVAIGAALIWRPATQAPAPGGDVLRSDRAVTLDLLSPQAGGSALGERISFEWQAIPEARRYDFLLLDAVGDIVSEVRTTEPSVELARGNLALDRDSSYYWSVRATLTDGTVVESGARGVSFP